MLAVLLHVCGGDIYCLLRLAEEWPLRRQWTRRSEKISHNENATRRSKWTFSDGGVVLGELLVYEVFQLRVDFVPTDRGDVLGVDLREETDDFRDDEADRLIHVLRATGEGENPVVGHEGATILLRREITGLPAAVMRPLGIEVIDLDSGRFLTNDRRTLCVVRAERADGEFDTMIDFQHLEGFRVGSFLPVVHDIPGHQKDTAGVLWTTERSRDLEDILDRLYDDVICPRPVVSIIDFIIERESSIEHDTLSKHHALFSSVWVGLLAVNVLPLT